MENAVQAIAGYTSKYLIHRAVGKCAVQTESSERALMFYPLQQHSIFSLI